MKQNYLTLAAIAIATQSAFSQVPVDFSKIKTWVGEGENRAALVVYNNSEAADPHAYVWGYRWPKGETRNGEDLFKAICAGTDNLVLLTQTTGSYGSTVCGIGYGNAENILKNVYYDFDKAKDFEFINFDFYNSSSLFGQKEAPGDDTPEICQEAIDKALSSGHHYIQHPLDQPSYGYPAYDYDCWEFKDEGWEDSWWSSAWYEGYWSYWTATHAEEDGEWMYSGSGFTGRQLYDGAIDGWSYTMFEQAMVGGMGEGDCPPEKADNYVYVDRPIISGVELNPEEESGVSEGNAEYFTLQGIRLDSERLDSGIYIKVLHGNVSKIYIP